MNFGGFSGLKYGRYDIMISGCSEKWFATIFDRVIKGMHNVEDHKHMKNILKTKCFLLELPISEI